MQQYGLTSFRIGKYKGETLKLASTREILCKAGRAVRFPQGNSDTYAARRWLPYGATAGSPNTFFPTTTNTDRGESIVNSHKTAEGVTSTPDALVPQDIQVVMQQFDCLYGFTDKMLRLGEDDLLAQMSKQIAQRTALVNELQVFGVLKGGTNIFYGGTGTSRATTNGRVTLNMVRKITKSLAVNHAEEVTEVLSAGNKFGTTPVEPGFIFYGHTDLAPDIRDLPGFTPTVEYASGTPMPFELGKTETIRFILSPEFPPILNGGASVASAPGYQYDPSGTSNDVYTFLVTAADAWSSVAVRGMDAMKVNFVAPESSPSDPHGQRGYTGAIWWKATLIENNGWMAVGHVLASALPN
jgi:N4-gp56 family major capsid protein